MREDDGRKLSHDTLEELRIRAVRAVEASESQEQVVAALGFSRPRIYEWLASYREGGIEALRARPIPGRPSRLDAKALCWIYDSVTTHNPMQMKFEFALWTRDMVRELIRERFNIRLSEVSVGRLLLKLGLSPQRPLTRAYQRDPALVEAWLRDQFPAIQKEGKRVGASIFFADEASVRSDYHSGTTWAPVGQTPVIERTGARHSLNMISAVSPRGELRFMCHEGKFNATLFVEFMQRLLLNRRTPIFLIVDGHPVHRAGAVKKFLADHHHRIHLFRLPSYRPDLNPDELVWAHLKHHKMGKVAITGPDKMKQQVMSFLRSLQKTPALVRAMFQHPSVRYVA